MEPNAAPIEEDDAPKIYGNYEVVRVIGKGKFAVVYRAKRISDGEIVALKRINVDAIDPVSREKCLKEIRLLQSLDHPNIIKYLDSFISDNDLVIVIEWAAAGDLKRQIRKAQERGVGFEERLIWKYFSQICDAMQHMHEKRIMHRDLKPANIFLTLDGTIKVGDLGLSRELSEHTLQAHSKVGTPLYMSPEVLRGDGYEFKSDIWSLGCLLYELAMLKSPFKSEGLNLYSLFQKISQGDYQPLPDNYSEQLRSLAYSMISTKSEERPDLTTVCQIASQMRNLTARKTSEAAAASSSKAMVVARPDEPEAIAPMGQNLEPKSTPQPVVEDVVTAKESKDSRVDSKSQSLPRNNKTSSRNSAVRETSDVGNVANTAAEAKESSRYIRPEPNVDSKVSSQQQYGNGGSERERQTTATQSHSAKQTEPSKGAWDSDVNYSEVHTTPVQSSTANKAVPYSRPKVIQKSEAEESKGSANKKGTRPREQTFVEEGGEIPSERDNNEPASEHMQKASNAIALMDILFSKLAVLDFPINYSESGGSNKPLLPLHFACDLSLLGRVAGYSTGGRGRTDAGEFSQFRRMVEVARWLLTKIGGTAQQLVSSLDIQRDAPMTISKQLLGAATAAGIAATELTEIIPTSLLPGFGEKVCTFLLALCDRALALSGKIGQPLVYHQNNGSILHANGPEVDDDVVDEEAAEETVEPVDGAVRSAVEDAGILDEDSIMSMVLPSVDPSVWKLELERVTPLLVAGQRQQGLGSSWGDHFNSMRSLSSPWMASDSADGSTQARASELSDMLEGISRYVKNDLVALGRGEETMLKRGAIPSLASDYRQHKQAAIELVEKSTALSKRVESFSNQYSQIEEKLEEVTEQLDAKVGGDSKGDSSGGIIQLKEAIKTVKDESNTMSIQIGLVSAYIMDRRLALANHQSMALRSKREKKSISRLGRHAKKDVEEDLDASLE